MCLRCVVLSEPLRNDSRSSESWGQMLSRMRQLLLQSFNKSLSRFEEYMRAQRERRTEADWNFNQYFMLQVSIPTSPNDQHPLCPCPPKKGNVTHSWPTHNFCPLQLISSMAFQLSYLDGATVLLLSRSDLGIWKSSKGNVFYLFFSY